MKAAEFDYVKAKSLDEICLFLSQQAGEARIIAGGQTLVPLMAMRMARPNTLIDINDVEELKGIEITKKSVIIKACTRQSEVLESVDVRRSLPILSDALSHVGHTQTRNRGTVGGSLVNADPSAEISLIARLLDAEMTMHSVRGERVIKAANFFSSAMITNLDADECLTQVCFPIWSSVRTGFGFHETSIRASDYALASAAAQLSLDSSGQCRSISIVIGGATEIPTRISETEEQLMGSDLSDTEIKTAMEKIPEMLEPQADVHADADYRRRVACVLVGRALKDARERAKGSLV